MHHKEYIRSHCAIDACKGMEAESKAIENLNKKMANDIVLPAIGLPGAMLHPPQ